MYSRRLLRIKVMQLLYAYLKTGSSSLDLSEKELFHSIQKTFDLYHYLILLVLDIRMYAIGRIELALNKKQPSYEDLNPNNRFTDNQLLNQLAENRQLRSILEQKKMGWNQYPELIKKLYKEMVVSEWYREYMSNKENSYELDREAVCLFFSEFLLYSEDLEQNLEEQSIYWNDEVDFVINMIVKTLKRFRASQGSEARLMKMYKSDDDETFTRTLFRKSIVNFDEYLRLIEGFSHNWDIERIAFLDNLIMVMAITEMTEFPDIPVKVSFNEYIELAKLYSTDKSSHFVNGVLDKIIQQLRSEKRIVKKGRGLIGEI